MRNFELFMGRLCNGVTVCNKAVMESGDYKMIAHISHCGKIRWYSDRQKVPADALESIERAAAREREDFDHWLSSLGELRAYGYLLDHVPHADFMRVTGEMKGASLAERVEYLKSVYVNIA